MNEYPESSDMQINGCLSRRQDLNPEPDAYKAPALPVELQRPAPASRRDSGFYIPLHRAVQPSFILKEVAEPAPGSALDLNP